MSFVKIQRSRTKKGRRYTTKLSIVTIWTLFCVPVLVWVSGCPQNQNTFCNNSERIFIRHAARVGSAAHRYCEQLLMIIQASRNIAQLVYIIPTMAAHGTRKESGARHVACTQQQPHLQWCQLQIGVIGQWEKFDDVHWQFADAGNAHLSRLLPMWAALTPTSVCFLFLCPHWTVDNPRGIPCH